LLAGLAEEDELLASERHLRLDRRRPGCIGIADAVTERPMVIALQEGARIGPYTLGREIGRGGFAFVFETDTARGDGPRA